MVEGGTACVHLAGWLAGYGSGREGIAKELPPPTVSLSLLFHGSPPGSWAAGERARNVQPLSPCCARASPFLQDMQAMRLWSPFFAGALAALARATRA